MQLGTQTNSLINHLQSRMVIGQPEAVEGMGVTLLSWTDRDPGTIRVVSLCGKWITVQADRTINTGGSEHDGTATYTFESDKHGQWYYFKQMENGMWQEMVKNRATSRWNKSRSGHGLCIGARDRYRDPSF